jgi:hypothetical protein
MIKFSGSSAPVKRIVDGNYWSENLYVKSEGFERENRAPTAEQYDAFALKKGNAARCLYVCPLLNQVQK